MGQAALQVVRLLFRVVVGSGNSCGGRFGVSLFQGVLTVVETGTQYRTCQKKDYFWGVACCGV